MTRVLLIRHGETEWNRERRWQGHADVPLSPEGVRQAERLARWLCRERPGVRALYSSDLDRAARTARAVGAAYGVDPILDPVWREMDVGAWSGLGRPEIEIRFAEEWRRILSGEDLRRGGGETFAGFTDRIVSALERLPMLHPDGNAAVVTHGGVIRAALLHLRGLPFARLREISPVDNAAFAELSSNGGGWEVLGFGAESFGSVEKATTR